ncbi:MAG: hypothetical protein ABIW02_01675 [Nitrosospira sp.]
MDFPQVTDEEVIAILAASGPLPEHFSLLGNIGGSVPFEPIRLLSDQPQ